MSGLEVPLMHGWEEGRWAHPGLRILRAFGLLPHRLVLEPGSWAVGTGIGQVGLFVLPSCPLG
jgi:hypothetical protein